MDSSFEKPLLPPVDQVALLRAVLGPRDEFQSRLRAWEDLVQGNPPPESFVLLQLLLPRLREFGGSEQLVDLCRRQLRLTWARARLIEMVFARVARQMRDEGIVPIVVKGLALQKYYDEPGLRALGDVDLLVPRRQFAAAVDLLRRCDFKVVDFAAPRHFDDRFQHALLFRSPDGNFLDLHAHLLHETSSRALAGSIFESRTQPFRISSAQALTLCREHHVIHQIEHAYTDPEIDGRWIADAAVLIKGGTVDWQVLEKDAAALGLGPLVATGLQILTRFGVSVPHETVERLAKAEPGRHLKTFWSNPRCSITEKIRYHFDTLYNGSDGNWLRFARNLPTYAKFVRARRGGLLRRSTG